MNFQEMNTKNLLKLFQKDTLYKKMDLLRSLTNEMYAELKMRGVEC